MMMMMIRRSSHLLLDILSLSVCWSNSSIKSCLGFEVFTAVTMKNAVFWDVATCGSSKNRRFGKCVASIFWVEEITLWEKMLDGWRRNVGFYKAPHGATSQKTAPFKVCYHLCVTVWWPDQIWTAVKPTSTQRIRNNGTRRQKTVTIVSAAGIPVGAAVEWFHCQLSVSSVMTQRSRVCLFSGVIWI
jgi:hypothetical protein